MSNRIEDLDRRMQPSAYKLEHRCLEKWIPTILLETRRSLAVAVLK